MTCLCGHASTREDCPKNVGQWVPISDYPGDQRYDRSMAPMRVSVWILSHSSPNNTFACAYATLEELVADVRKEYGVGHDPEKNVQDWLDNIGDDFTLTIDHDYIEVSHEV